MDLTALAYTSTATANLRTAGAMDELLLKARAFNSQVGVTGVLLHNDGTFFQYIEGPTQAVEEVYRRILKSPGHCHVYELFRDRISQCHFSSWTMGFAQPSATELQAIAQAQWRHQQAMLEQQSASTPALAILLTFWRHSIHAT